MRGLEKLSVLWYNGYNKNPPRAGACGSCEVGRVICGLRSDHNLDHLQVRTTWELWTLWHEKARISDKKAPKSTRKEAKNRYFFVWDVDAAGSNPVTPTKIAALTAKSKPQSRGCFAAFNVFITGGHMTRQEFLKDYWQYYLMLEKQFVNTLQYV